MPSQLNTLDHEVMRILTVECRDASVEDLVGLAQSTKQKVSKSLAKLMELNFVSRRVECDALPLYRLVLDCPYFPPLVQWKGRTLSYDEEELGQLVAECEKQFH